jgi:peptide/nickel transport system substrate-binding protein
VRRRAALSLLLATSLSACMPKVDEGDRAHTFVVALAAAPSSLDPAVFASTIEQPVQLQIYQQLVRFDATQPDGVRGDLARAWRIAPDRLSIDFELEPGNRFSDGTPVDAEAVKASFDRVRQVGRSSAGFLEWLDSVEVTGPMQVRLHLKRPYAPAIQMLAQQACSIVSPSAVRAHDKGDHAAGWLADHSAGSGPYKLRRINGASAVLEANAYAKSPPLQFTRVIFRFLPDEGVRRLLLERGDVDLVDVVSAAFVERYRALPGVAISMIPAGPSLNFLTLNTARGPMRDVRLRRAVAAAVDYDGLRDKVLKGNASTIRGFLPVNGLGADVAGPLPHQDLPLARRLLKEAGYDGRPLSMIIGQLGPASEFLQSNLAQAGFNVQLERRSWGAIDALERSGDFDLVYDGWLLDTPDPSSMMASLFASRNIRVGANFSAVSDPEADALIDRALGETDRSRRGALLHRIDLRLRELQPVVMVFASSPVIAYRRDIEGVRLEPANPFAFPVAGLRRRSQPGAAR